MRLHQISGSVTEHTATLSFDSLGLAVELPLDPIFQWWNGLVERNRRVRQIEEFGKPVVGSVFQHRCPNCSADFSHLALIEREDRTVRACMACRCEFKSA